MTILVTGAAGFVGAALCNRLRADGHTVVATDLRTEPPLRPLDVTDRRAVRGLIGQTAPDVVVHAAAIVDDRGPRAQFERVNVGGTRHIIEACASQGVGRLVHISSIAALGVSPGRCDQATPLAMTTGSPYFDTKAASEWLVRRAHGQGKVSGVIVRPGDVWGLGSIPWVERPLALIRARQPVLVGGGNGRVNHCWIDNLIDGITLAVAHADAPGGCFTFHDEQDTRVKTYLTRLARAAGIQSPLRGIPTHVATGIAHAFRVAGPITKLAGIETPFTPAAVRYLTRESTHCTATSRDVLGWRPAVQLDEGMQRLANHWQGSLKST